LQYTTFTLIGLILFVIGIVFLIVCGSAIGDSTSLPRTPFTTTTLDFSIVFTLSGFGLLIISTIKQFA
jgi:hypothetical protein